MFAYIKVSPFENNDETRTNDRTTKLLYTFVVCYTKNIFASAGCGWWWCLLTYYSIGVIFHLCLALVWWWMPKRGKKHDDRGAIRLARCLVVLSYVLYPYPSMFIKSRLPCLRRNSRDARYIGGEHAFPTEVSRSSILPQSATKDLFLLTLRGFFFLYTN